MLGVAIQTFSEACDSGPQNSVLSWVQGPPITKRSKSSLISIDFFFLALNKHRVSLTSFCSGFSF